MQRQSTSLGEGTRDDRDGDVIVLQYRGKVLFGGIKIWRAVEIPTLDEEHPLVELGDQQAIAASLSLSLSLSYY